MKITIIPLLGLLLFYVPQTLSKKLMLGSGSGVDPGSGIDLEPPRKAVTRVVVTTTTTRPTPKASTASTTTTVAPKRIVPVATTTQRTPKPASTLAPSTSLAKTIIISDDEDEDDVILSSGVGSKPQSGVVTDDSISSGSGDFSTTRIVTVRTSTTASTITSTRPTESTTVIQSTPSSARSTPRSTTATPVEVVEEEITTKKDVILHKGVAVTSAKPKDTASSSDVVVNVGGNTKYEKPAEAEDPDSSASGKDGMRGVDEPEREPIKPEGALFSHPGILAAVIGGGVVALLSALLLIMFIVYRMRKKDEGSYPLDDSKPRLNVYTRAPNKEFYA